MKYRYVGSHADSLASGAPVGPGDFVELTDDDAKDPHNRMLVEDGRLIEAEDPPQQEQAKSKTTTKEAE